jgi:hypothetical protein
LDHFNDWFQSVQLDENLVDGRTTVDDDVIPAAFFIRSFRQLAHTEPATGGFDKPSGRSVGRLRRFAMLARRRVLDRIRA